MEDESIDSRIFVNVVRLILDYFVEIVKTVKSNDQPHFDIELTNENNFYTIYVTNCDCSIGNCREIIILCFNELSKNIMFESYFKSITTFKKRSDGNETAYDFQYSENCHYQFCIRKMNAAELKRFAHLNVYQSFMLKTTLPSKDIEKFMEYLLKSITTLIDSYGSSLNNKYTVRIGEKIIFQNRGISKKDMINCTIISSAIKKIIERCTNEEFRRRCFSLLGVEQSNQTGDAIMNKLVPLLNKSSPQENTSNDIFSKFSKNHQTIVTTKENQEKRKKDEEILTKDDDKENTSNNKNQETNIVVSPIIMSSRGRRIKRTKLYNI